MLLGVHDLVVLPVLEHAVLVDAGLVRERVLADDGLVHLHREAGDLRDQPAGGEDLLGDDAGVDAEAARARVLMAITTSSMAVLPARSPMPLTVHSIWRAPFSHRRQRVGRRHAEVVVAVRAPDHAVGAGHALAQHAEERAVLLGQDVAGGVGHVDHSRARLDHGREDLDQVVGIAARGVLGGELDVVEVLAAPG